MLVLTWMPVKGYRLGMQKSGTASYEFNERDEEELVASSPSQRNWRGIGIALLVIVVICSLIVTAVIFLTPGDSGSRVKGEQFTFEDFLGDNFTARHFNGTWISDTEFVFRNKNGDLLLYDAEIRNATLLVSNVPFRKFNAHSYHLSPDRKFVLFACDMQKLFRYSFYATYRVYDIDAGDAVFLGPVPRVETKLQYAGWGPVGSSLVFVFQNNLYYQSRAFDDTVQQLTNTSPDSAILNGIPDWVYEEEILSSNSAVWFSKNGQLLCFATFNDSHVPLQTFEWYGSPERGLLYTQPDAVRYPKPGTPNPIFHLMVVNVSDIGLIIEEHLVTPPASILTEEEDHYFTAVTWTSDTNLSVIWMNRRQNLSIITICSPPDWICKEIHREDTKALGWVDWYDPPVFTPDGTRFFVRGLVRDGEDCLFRQVVSRVVGDPHTKTLTMMKGEVTKINSYDKENDWVYFTAAPFGEPGERHLYRIQANTSNSNTIGECLTCSIGEDCLFIEAQFSTDAKYFVLDCEGPKVPKQYLFDARSNELVSTLENNEDLSASLAKKALPQVETFKVPLSDGSKANVRLLLPPELNKDEITLYPLVINVYGGPGSQEVDEKFSVGWGTYLASNASFIYGKIDGRGSGFQSEDRKFKLYRKLGTVEVEDQIAVTKYLIANLPFIDKQRVAIWGWSYGGFVTAQVMAKDVDVFRCGISVAPVTSWEYYDSVYTERYMGFPSPDDNRNGYLQADVLRLAPNFKTKKYFLIHGTADDNVHFQQSMLLSSALAHANVIFRTQVYPDENHALGGVQRHLYMSMLDFLQECFEFVTKQEPVPEVSDKNDCEE